MNAQTHSRAPWLAILFGALYLTWEMFVFAALPALAPSRRILLSLLGVAFLPLMAYGIARHRAGPAVCPADLVRPLRAPRPRGEQRYLWMALLFGSLYLIWWIVGLLALPSDALTQPQKIAWGLIGIPSLLLAAHGFARYWRP